jgi:hypothetical protein
MNKSFAILFGAVLAAGVTSVGCQSNEGPAASDNSAGGVSNVIDTRGDSAAVDNQGEGRTEGTPTANVGTDSQPDASADAGNDAGENAAKPQDHDYEARGGEADAGETGVIDTTDGANTEPVANVNADAENTDATATENAAPEAGVNDSATTTDGGADTGNSAGTDKASDAGTGEATPDSGAAATGND